MSRRAGVGMLTSCAGCQYQVISCLCQLHAAFLLPTPKIVGLDQNDVILFQHRHQFVFQFLLPRLTFVEFRLHRFAAGQIWKGAREEECVGSSIEGNGPMILIPILRCAGMLWALKIARNSSRMPGLVW